MLWRGPCTAVASPHPCEVLEGCSQPCFLETQPLRWACSLDPQRGCLAHGLVQQWCYEKKQNICKHWFTWVYPCKPWLIWGVTWVYTGLPSKTHRWGNVEAIKFKALHGFTIDGQTHTSISITPYNVQPGFTRHWNIWIEERTMGTPIAKMQKWNER